VAHQECFCPVEAVVLPGIRHIPYREAPERTVDAVAEFINRLLRDHQEAGPPAEGGTKTGTETGTKPGIAVS